jgi:SAM-dependent methyltransferase
MVRRDGGDAGIRARNHSDLTTIRDGVLDRADLQPDSVLLDVGTGTGLIGLGALERLGPDGRVLFTDISADLIDQCRRATGDDPRCAFVQAAAEDLSAVPSGSVDVVTLRSVLMYSSYKDEAFGEFFRVLRPGGRLAMFEPVNQFLVRHGPAQLFGLAGTPVDDLLVKVGAAYRLDGEDAGGPRGIDAMVDFDERDLLRWAEQAGFEAIELDYRAQLRVPAEPIADWQALKSVAPNPLVPTYGEVIDATLTDEERERLDAFMVTAVADRLPTRRTLAIVYLRAVRP